MGMPDPGHGLFISIAVLKTGSPSLYIPVALCADPGRRAGTGEGFPLLRFLKIRILYQGKDPAP